MINWKPIQQGRKTRMSFAKIDEVMEMPNLIEVQKDSYQWFLDKGLREVFRDIDEITDYSDNLVLTFVDYKMDNKPKYSIKECKERDATYAVPLRVKARLLNKASGIVKESEVYMGEFPKMTESGTFVINGAERVIISQLVRSPGVYYDMSRDKTGKKLFTATVIPNRGAWLEYETDQNDIFYVRIDKTRKIPVTTFVMAIGCFLNNNVLSSKAAIDEYFGYDDRIKATIEKDGVQNTSEALLEVHRKLRPGEPPTLDTAKSYLEALFFDEHRYDISRVGRYKYNKKLGMADRLKYQVLAEPIINPSTGELMLEAGVKVSMQQAAEIEQAGVDIAYVDVEGKKVKIIATGMVDILPYLYEIEKAQSITLDMLEEIGINEKVSFKVLVDVLEHCEDKSTEEILEILEEKAKDLVPRHIVVEDILATINYLNCLGNDVGSLDDIDHLGNRRIRSVGELLQNQMRIGFTRMERVVKERMSLQSQDGDAITPQQLISIRPVASAIKEFFGSSPLSQFMDQNNPLAELTHKRRLSALGPGGLSRDRAGFEVRDVHYSHYGRMCPIETPEGPNIGLISSLATFARINKYGFVEAPFRKVVDGVVTKQVEYMTADIEDEYQVAQANEPLDENGKFKNERVTVRFRDEFREIPASKADYMDVSPKMVVSVATAMIPFLENDDANRALMGSNMQKQAVPLLQTDSPIVGTGIEYKAVVDSGVAVIAKYAGTVTKVSADAIEIQRKDENIKDTYELIKFMRSNQGTCVNQRPIVSVGEEVNKMDVIADGPATCDGEISLGKNALIGFMTWEGYNYEDAVLLNEKLVRDDVYTSIHIAEYEIEARDTKLGKEEITRDIPNVGEDALRNLDENGIIRVGAEVSSGDILVGKVTPKGETELTSEERLLRAIFGEKAREVRDTSLKVPHGEYGIVAHVDVFDRDDKNNELSPGVNKVVRCYIAQKRKISVGDKMAGRHGNKGVVSRILPQEDMPFLPDGTPLDIVLNPLGVPSRMNIGQVLEVTLGYACKKLGEKDPENDYKPYKIMTPVFDGAHESDVKNILRKAGLDEDGKTVLYDGRTGEQFDNKVTVGIMYFLKLHHLVDDKIHARSTGPYSLVTQQPLGGKAQFGGQRFGEMEVWALEAYGAAYTLQEILTVKSDDVVGRVKAYESIVKGQNVPKPGVPESFKVLIKELQSLCLDVKVLDENDEEIDLKQDYDDEGVEIDTSSVGSIVNDAEDADGYSIESSEDDDSDENYDNSDDDDMFADYYSGIISPADDDIDDVDFPADLGQFLGSDDSDDEDY